MAKKKKVRFEKKRNANGAFYYSIFASNGNNLNPSDPQKSKATVTKAILSFIESIKSDNFEIIDLTKKKKAV